MAPQAWFLKCALFLLALGDCMFIDPVSFIRPQARTKREANVTHLNDPNECLLKCNNALLANLWNNTATNHSSANANCKARLDEFRCFDKCPSSRLKDLLKSNFDMTSLVCSDEGKKYMASYGCLQQVLPPVNSTCDETCEEYGNTSLAILNSVHFSDFGTIFYEADSSVVNKAVGDVCKLFQCKSKCTMPGITSKCGKDTAVTSSKVTKATLNQCINSYRVLGVWSGTPSECKTIL